MKILIHSMRTVWMFDIFLVGPANFSPKSYLVLFASVNRRWFDRAMTLVLGSDCRVGSMLKVERGVGYILLGINKKTREN